MKFSCFKRDFLGAPMRKALTNFKNGMLLLSPQFLTGQGSQSDNCEIPYRTDEKYWVVASKAEVTVSFALQFDN